MDLHPIQSDDRRCCLGKVSNESSAVFCQPQKFSHPLYFSRYQTGTLNSFTAATFSELGATFCHNHMTKESYLFIAEVALLKV